jgi:heme exporter protein A
LRDGLRVTDLSRRFGPRWVLARVSFAVGPGQGLMLLGANGSGKTTLLRCLGTALKPHGGGATWDGVDVWTERDQLRPAIALLSHATRLYDDLSATQNLRAWASMGGYDPGAIPALLDRVGLSATADRPAGAFSAGMRRRLALALALMKRPRLALFDEPFTSLDVEGRALVHDVLDELAASGATLIVSTHHPESGARHCARALRLGDGRVVWEGPAADAVGTPEIDG